ncbi:IEV morphogenesis [Eptesipox virus]|uniref:IEV morphogenesis n=1 Tax=Eptesipox virus TaxID=1329402 RepID=A0A220T699_9POXV|nr:IEV morphogenesis [Eptesipox virus]ASK51237.1 IEV morphogenesis [Eptesipox virus]WAH70995.1 IEV morphogenesis [Eptesipox virus]
MLSINAIKDSFNDNNSKTITEAFYNLKLNEALRYILINLHPQQLPKKWYTEIVEVCATKLYLFKPQHILFTDLVSILTYQKNISLYANHINFFKNDILMHCSSEIITKCIEYLILSDDDIRLLKDRFSYKELEYFLTYINEDSILSMNYIFNETLTENIFIKNHYMYECLYDHQTYSVTFLQEMLYKYGIVPNNIGIIDFISKEIVIEILIACKEEKDIIKFIDMLDEDIKTSEVVQNFVIDRVMSSNCANLFKFYISEYLFDQRDKFGIFQKIFFDIDDDITKYKNISKQYLETICNNIDRYESHLEYIVNYIIQNNYIDLLALIINSIPKSILTEELCIRIVCDSKIKVSVCSLPIHSSLVMTVCKQMKYVDMVEFLDTLDINLLIEKDVELITDYTFTTNWFNKCNELINVYIKKYKFSPLMMKKLMFDYPLTLESSMYLLNTIELQKEISTFYPNIASSFIYLLNNKYKLKQKRILNKNVDIPCKKFNKDYKTILLKPDSKELKSTILISNIPDLYTCVMEDISKVKTKEGCCIQFKPSTKKIMSDYERIKKQIYDIAKLASYGLYYISNVYLPNWVPIVNVINGKPYTHPTRIEHCVILDISPGDFIEFNYLGQETFNIYNLTEPMSNYHAAINSLISVLFIYIVIGSVKYCKIKLEDFISSIIDSFCTGMKINEIIYEDITDVCKEINNLKSYASDSSFMFIKKNTLVKTLELCEKVCIAIILDNN